MITMSGPSGAGKDTVIRRLVQADPNLIQWISTTTRPPRAYEVPGEHYYFVKPETFLGEVAKGNFLEHNPTYHGVMYGTRRAEVERHFMEGRDVISDINWVGVEQLRSSMGSQLFSICILPPSLEELENRFASRMKTSAEQREKIEKRLEKIRVDLNYLDEPDYVFTNADLAGSTQSDYDIVLFNDDLDTTVAEAYNAIQTYRRQLKEQADAAA